MQFNSYIFAVFFIFVLGVQLSSLPWKIKKINLLFCSYLFYAAWKLPYLALIWLSTLVDWQLANAMAKQLDSRARKFLLVISLCVNLGILAVFKYCDFILESISVLISALGFDYQAPHVELILPIGISFYTFQTLSYTIDVYRRQIKPEPSLLNYAMYVAFFPQLVAGPIVRAKEFLPQCLNFKRPCADDIGWGACLFLIGLWQKVALADGLLAPVVDGIFEREETPGFWFAWTGAIGFCRADFL